MRENEFPIPIEWKDHFGEEKFFDIFVYTHYGGMAPSEALKVLNLEAPPEKKIEPKVKQEVSTPEIIKEDKNKEVKKEVEKMEKKSSMFNFTEQQEQERSGKSWFSSMEGQGYEEIELPREDLFGDRKRGRSPGSKRTKIREIPIEIGQSLQNANAFYDGGSFNEKMHHHRGVMRSLEKGGDIDRDTFRSFDRLTKEADEIKGNREEEEKILKKVNELLRGLQTQKK